MKRDEAYLINVLYRAALHFTGCLALACMERRCRMLHGIDPPTFDDRAQPPLPTEDFFFDEWKHWLGWPCRGILVGCNLLRLDYDVYHFLFPSL